MAAKISQKDKIFNFAYSIGAAIVILGFSVLGTELYNPKVRDFFVKRNLCLISLLLFLVAIL